MAPLRDTMRLINGYKPYFASIDRFNKAFIVETFGRYVSIVPSQLGVFVNRSTFNSNLKHTKVSACRSSAFPLYPAKLHDSGWNQWRLQRRHASSRHLLDPTPALAPRRQLYPATACFRSKIRETIISQETHLHQGNKRTHDESDSSTWFEIT